MSRGTTTFAFVKDRWDEATRQVREALDNLLGSFPTGEVIEADSRAMRELAEEPQLAIRAEGGKSTGRSPWGETPVRTAHSIAALHVHLAVDCARAFLVLVDYDAPVIFGVGPVARASLENFARARWLYDPDISTRLRVARAMNDRLEGLRQQARLPHPDARRSAGRARDLLKAAKSLGLPIVKGARDTKWIAEVRPSSTRLMEALIDFSEEIGLVGYNFLSGVDHGLPHGLNPFLRMELNSPFSIYGKAQVSLDSNLANTIGALLISGSVQALEEQSSFLGITRDSWSPAAGRGLQAVLAWSERRDLAKRARSGDNDR
jgi:hypothetical protein